MRAGLLAYYRDAGYTEPMESDGWKLFPQPTLPANPDALLLIQDAEWARACQDIPGYTD